MSALSEEDIQSLFMWIDEIPLSRPKKNLSRDFSDGVLAAEVVKHFVPKLVELHNYPPANSTSQKIYNWSTLNEKVFRKLGYCINDSIINAIVNYKSGYVEYLLFELRQKIEEYLVQKPAIPKIHKPKSRQKLVKQNSEKSLNSDRTNQNDKDDRPVSNFNGVDQINSEGYQNEPIQEKDNNQYLLNNPLYNGVYRNFSMGRGGLLSPNQAEDQYTALQSPVHVPQSEYLPKNYSNTSSKISNSPQASHARSKPRVMIQEPVPHYKTPNVVNEIPNQGITADYGREIAETLRMMQLKIEKLETLLELKDRKIQQLSKRINKIS